MTELHETCGSCGTHRDPGEISAQYDTHGGILMFPNKWGYRVNISHPEIKPLWERFHQWKGIPMHFPLSDAERFEFEGYIFKMLEKRKKAAESGDLAAARKEKIQHESKQRKEAQVQ